MNAVQTALASPSAPVLLSSAPGVTTTSRMPAMAAFEPFDVERIRADFPILQLQIDGKPLVYLDNAASSRCRSR